MKTLKYQGNLELSYYSKKEMNEMYSNKRYRVLGEINKKLGSQDDMPLDDGSGNKFYVQRLGTYRKPLYKTDGYYWSEEAQGFVIVKKSNLYNLLVGSILSIILMIGLFFGVQFLLNNSNLDPNAKAFDSEITRPEDMDETRILVPGYNDWNMLAGTDEVYIALYNPDKNPCYFEFSVILDETQEELFKTGLVPPGQAVTTVKLPRTLEKGVYPITVNINSFSIDDESQRLNGGEVKTNIVVYEE